MVINKSQRNRQFKTLERYKSKLSNYNYSLIRNWIINWEFMGKTGDRNLMLNIKDRISKS